jgi:hypothetical protein
MVYKKKYISYEIVGMQTLAARHTVQARAPLTTGVLPLCKKVWSGNQRRMRGEVRRTMTLLVDPPDGPRNLHPGGNSSLPMLD